MEKLPDWAQEVMRSYESSAAGCFMLHGNVSDRMVVKSAGKTTIGGIQEFLMEVILPRFDVVITYDLGYGIRIERGGSLFGEWPTYQEIGDLPRDPLPAISFITHYLTYCRNLKFQGVKPPKVAVIIKQTHLVCPEVQGSSNTPVNAVATFLRSWAENERIQQSGQVAFLLTESAHSVHNLVSGSPRIAELEVPLPSKSQVEDLLTHMVESEVTPLALKEFDDLEIPADRLVGATLSSVEALLLRSEYDKKSLVLAQLNKVKRDLVEKDCEGLIGFVEPDRDLTDIIGLEGVKTWLRQDIDLWNKNELDALPMGYLFCGPVGTGKTYLAECLAGEAGVPVITMRNFRDKWVGSTEANLEKIFSLIHALGRCIVFVDEADQALGKRQGGSGDSGVSSRVYSMMAKEMSNTRNRGKVLWVLASSRPDLIEVDLKRPGRIDVKIPLFPCLTDEQSFALIRALAKRREIIIPEESIEQFRGKLPQLLTPGAAEALVVQLYRVFKTSELSELEALSKCLEVYRPPVNINILKVQMQLAVEEATDSSMIPEAVTDLLVDVDH